MALKYNIAQNAKMTDAKHQQKHSNNQDGERATILDLAQDSKL